MADEFTGTDNFGAAKETKTEKTVETTDESQSTEKPSENDGRGAEAGKDSENSGDASPSN